tara:strand:+ start:8018 stop:8182 length:165 start_codon:yes stop_codon:yes gene_type:complete
MKTKNKLRNYSYDIRNDEIVIFEQEKEDENTFNCISQIIMQLTKEGYKQKFNLK